MSRATRIHTNLNDACHLEVYRQPDMKKASHEWLEALAGHIRDFTYVLTFEHTIDPDELEYIIDYIAASALDGIEVGIEKRRVVADQINLRLTQLAKGATL